MQRRSPLCRALLPLAVLGLVAGACGGDDSADETTAPSAADTTAAPTTTAGDTTTTAAGSAAPSTTAAGGTEGCGPDAHTDAATLGADRPVARCEPGYPLPQPLPERTKVVISSTAQAETSAWLYLGMAAGEFEKENVEIELANLRFVEAIPQMLTGQVQAATGGAEAGWYNAVGQDIDVKWVFGNFFPPHAGDNAVPQTGLWVRRDVFSDPQNPDFTELNGKRLGSAVGNSSVIMYPISEAFTSLGADLASMQIQQLPAADVVTALENGAVDAAWLLDPSWTQIAANPDYVLAATQPPGEPIGGIYFGDQLLGEDREVGLAVIRALIRTVNTYLDGDYEADPEVVQALADALASTPEAVAGGDSESLVFDWEIREGTTDRTQAVFESLGVLEQPVIPEDQLVDRSLYLEAVGAE